jgi:hypothetical protein
MNIMHTSEERGVLILGGKPLSDEAVAALVGGEMRETLACLSELLEMRVFSRRKDGAIYSRRMVREEEKRRKCSDAGKKGGGNPTFKGDPKGTPKGHPKGDADIEIEIGSKQVITDKEGGVGGSPRGAYKHPVMVALRELERNGKKLYPHIRWVALKMGIEPPAEVEATIAEVDRMVAVYGQREVIAELAKIGGISIAEARSQANRNLAKAQPEKAAQQANKQETGPVTDWSHMVNE